MVLVHQHSIPPLKLRQQHYHSSQSVSNTYVPYDYDCDYPLFPSPSPSPSPHFSDPDYTIPQPPSRLGSPFHDFDFDFDFDSPFPMTSSSQNPRIRIQQSTPKLAGSSSFVSKTSSSTLDEGQQLAHHSLPHWAPVEANLLLPMAGGQPQASYRRYRGYHKRLSSGSSIGSAGPDSPYSHPHIVDPSTSSPHLECFDGMCSGAGQVAKNFVPSSNSSRHHHFLAPAFQDLNFSTCDPDTMKAAEEAMRDATLEMQPISDMENHKLDLSMSSCPEYEMGDDDRTRESADSRSTVPSFDRTMSAVYQDELYSPECLAPPAPTSHERDRAYQTQLFKPGVFTERLKAANERHLSANSASPVATATSRGLSPFSQDPEFATDGFSNTASSAADTAASRLEKAMVRNAQEIRARDYQGPNMQRDLGPSNTISPKLAVGDYGETEEAAKMPLFPQENLQKRENQFASRNPPNIRHLSRSDADSSNNSQRNYDNLQTNRRPNLSSFSPSSPSTQAQVASHNDPMPSLSSNVQLPTQYPFIQTSRRASKSIHSSSNPEFPASLPSMDSTKSEGSQPETVRFMTSDNDAMTVSPSSPSLQRPVDTKAASGPYSCTAAGCSQRFDTGSKLQKHQKDTHRQVSPQPTPATPTPSATSLASAPGSAAGAGANRNSQAGPHKCERLNPSTNKPCNTVFSRSYDLTRHEDTIHNNRKQKVRCTYCTEEKTFSRSDALTRHMRVVHPDVDFPGKNKRQIR